MERRRLYNLNTNSDQLLAVFRYGVLKEDEGIAFRGLFIIDHSQNLRQITINDLPVGRSVDETLRLIQVFRTELWGLIYALSRPKITCYYTVRIR